MISVHGEMVQRTLYALRTIFLHEPAFSESNHGCNKVNSFAMRIYEKYDDGGVLDGILPDRLHHF